MAESFAKPKARMKVSFVHQDELAHVDDPIHRDVSAIAVIGRTLFAACDETASVERLIFNDETGCFVEHSSFAVGDVFDLPDGRDGEMDIEGLSIDGRWLWICGSHSLKRDDPGSDGLAGLNDIDWDPNRAFLGRLPLIDRGDGVFEPVGAIEKMDGPSRMAAALPMDEDGGLIRRLLADDPLIGPYLDHPCKENGFDIEGLAARGKTVWLGLRGPVIGAYAMIVELKLKDKGDKTFKAKKHKKNDGARYRLYAIDLNGQAIRDLLLVEDTMYLLSGATTDLEAMQAVYAIEQWPPKTEVVRMDTVRRVIDLPVIRHSDHAEGLAMFEHSGKAEMLIAYDSPDESRIDDPTQTIELDVFDWPSAQDEGKAKREAKAAKKKKAA